MNTTNTRVSGELQVRMDMPHRRMLTASLAAVQTYMNPDPVTPITLQPLPDSESNTQDVEPGIDISFQY